MLTLHVEADSYDKLVKDCWAALGLELRNQKLAAPEPTKTAEPNGAAEKKAVGRPKKETVVETVVGGKPTEPVAVGIDPFPTPTPASTLGGTITLEQVRGALQAYADRMSGGKEGNIGIVKAREVLAKFNSNKGTPCQKISEVQDTDYAKVLAVCAA